MEFAAVSDVGLQRKNNEDNYFIYKNEKLYGGMVADGMGGHNAGEVASKMACEIIKQYIITKFNPDMDYMEIAELIRTAFIMANHHIYEASSANENAGMGTTATLAFVYEEKLIIAHVGDSRCYRITEDKIEQLTQDHSYVGELVRMGKISEDDAKSHPNKNVITRAIGTDKNLKVDINVLKYNYEEIFLCSDGLSNMLSDTQIKEFSNQDNLEKSLQDMVALANKKGGFDNITAVAFRNMKGEAGK